MIAAIIVGLWIHDPNDISVFKHPHLIAFYGATVILAYLSCRKKLSLIPLMGVEICFYLMTELGTTTWTGFIIWLSIGLICYFLYGRRNSKLNSPIKH